MRLPYLTIVVTGASSGLGKAMARAFVEEGANVVCASRSTEQLSTAVAEMTDASRGSALGVPTDVRSWEEVTHLVEATHDQYGEIDVFVNNAGVLQAAVTDDHTEHPVVDVPIEIWETIIDTNLTGVFLCTKAVLPEMLSRNAGRLIQISSGYGSRGGANRAPYATSKFGLEGFHESLALELEDSGVDTVTLRPPGSVYTERKGEAGRPKDVFQFESPEIVAEPAVRLAAGEGENGGRYETTADGTDFVEYSRA